MTLTPFAHAALCILGGMLLSLAISKLGFEAYAGVVCALVILVLAHEWRASRAEYTHDAPDE